mmetsp:Transcript_18489/g.37404  ORF Transcript_18489/g.37404 Transcript_18489/m.37404 type:complete len:102 (+) Transcript_18489:186-491(+)
METCEGPKSLPEKSMGNIKIGHSNRQTGHVYLCGRVELIQDKSGAAYRNTKETNKKSQRTDKQKRGSLDKKTDGIMKSLIEEARGKASRAKDGRGGRGKSI